MPSRTSKNWEWNYQYKGEQEVKTVRGHKAKDTKRWCRGKVGIEHQKCIVLSRDGRVCKRFEYKRFVNGSNSRWICYHYIECKVCGRHFRSLIGDECVNYDGRD